MATLHDKIYGWIGALEQHVKSECRQERGLS